MSVSGRRARQKEEACQASLVAGHFRAWLQTKPPGAGKRDLGLREKEREKTEETATGRCPAVARRRVEPPRSLTQEPASGRRFRLGPILAAACAILSIGLPFRSTFHHSQRSAQPR